jgi:CRP/FNR family transcriptional regulator, cyclic AMP receptor protein
MNTPTPSQPAPLSDGAGGAGRGVQRARPLHEFPALAQAASELLRTPTSLAELSLDDARRVASYMWVVGYQPGAVVIQEGDREHTGFMLLLLSGEVSIELAGAGVTEATPISVLGAGHLIGEMGVLDGAPRSMNCVAVSRVEAAALTRSALHQLIEEHPAVGARLMAAVAQRLAERLRAAGEQLRMLTQMQGR